MVWYGMVWYGMVWYGMVWFSKIRHNFAVPGMIRSGLYGEKYCALDLGNPLAALFGVA